MQDDIGDLPVVPDSVNDVGHCGFVLAPNAPALACCAGSVSDSGASADACGSPCATGEADVFSTPATMATERPSVRTDVLGIVAKDEMATALRPAGGFPDVGRLVLGLDNPSKDEFSEPKSILPKAETLEDENASDEWSSRLLTSEWPATVLQSVGPEEVELTIDNCGLQFLDKRTPENRNIFFYLVQLTKDEEILLRLCTKLRAKGVPVQVEDVNLQNPLFFAAREGRTLCVEWMVTSEGLKVTHVDYARQTALYYAARDGHTDCVRKLVLLGADVNHTDANGDAPIFYATRDNREATVKAMIELGANLGVVNLTGLHAISIARAMGHKKLQNLLRAAALASGTLEALGETTAAKRKTPTRTRTRSMAKKQAVGTADDPRSGASADASPIVAAANSGAVSGNVVEDPDSRPSSPTPDPEEDPASGVLTTGPEAPAAKSKRGGRRSRRGGQTGASRSKRLKKEAEEPEQEPEQEPEEEKSMLCVLQIQAPTDGWTTPSNEAISFFAELFPDVAAWDEMPDMTVDSVPRESAYLAFPDAYRDSWHSSAVQVLRELMTRDGVAMLQQPLLPVEQTSSARAGWASPSTQGQRSPAPGSDGCGAAAGELDALPAPSLTEIITNLFGGSYYQSVTNLFNDIEQLFYSHIRNHGSHTEAGQQCLSIREEFLRLARSAGLYELFAQETLRDRSLIQQVNEVRMERQKKLGWG